MFPKASVEGMESKEVLITGKTPFRIDVPYTLIEEGEKGEKPLIIYLHGYRQHIDLFRKKMESLLDLEAYHLFIQGPYPVYEEKNKRPVEEWGRAWYLYDGSQDQFVKSLELSSGFIQEVADKILSLIEVSRLAVVGYSMGGYQAGHFALSRWKHVNDLVVVGGRIKTEVFRERQGSYGHMNVLALHGRHDQSVKSDPQRKSAEELAGWGASVNFRETGGNHKLDAAYTEEIRKWLVSLGYK